MIVWEEIDMGGFDDTVYDCRAALIFHDETGWRLYDHLLWEMFGVEPYAVWSSDVPAHEVFAEAEVLIDTDRFWRVRKFFGQFEPQTKDSRRTLPTDEELDDYES